MLDMESVFQSFSIHVSSTKSVQALTGRGKGGKQQQPKYAACMHFILTGSFVITCGLKYKGAKIQSSSRKRLHTPSPINMVQFYRNCINQTKCTDRVHLTHKGLYNSSNILA